MTRRSQAGGTAKGPEALRVVRYRTTVKWHGREPGAWFTTEAKDPEEAEMIVNFLLHRDYNPEGTSFSTEPDPGGESIQSEVYYLDGTIVRSKPAGPPSAA